MKIPFNKPYLAGPEEDYIREAIASGNLITNGPFTRRCESWLQAQTGAGRVLLTHSCTAALEMSAVLINAGPGDEIIMPSFTFSSTANAFVLRGATPVFVDIRPDTLNIDERLIEAAITPQTRAIVVVHYAGVACDMDSIMAIARRHGLYVIEDAAQALLARYKDRPLGSIGHLGTLSFHAAKNVGCGEGGALLVNDSELADRAEIIHDKGVNRQQYLAGRIKKYSWVDIGLSSAIGELSSAYLLAQLESAERITAMRLALWQHYDDSFRPLFRDGDLQGLQVPADATHNGHIYALLLASGSERDRLQQQLADRGIGSASHYEPLHSSVAGQRYGRSHGRLENSTTLPARLLRLPLWPDLPAGTIETVSSIVEKICKAGEPPLH